MDAFGDRLREERLRIGMTQAELAEAAGVKRNAQMNYESGARAPDKTYMANVMKAGIDMIYVLSGIRSNGDVQEALTRREVQLLDVFRELDEDNQEQVIVIMDAMLHRQYFPLRQGGGPSGAAEGSDE